MLQDLQGVADHLAAPCIQGIWKAGFGKGHLMEKKQEGTKGAAKTDQLLGCKLDL